MAEDDQARVREDSDRILVNIRDAFRGTASAIGWIATTIPDRVTTALLGILAIALWHTSTRFHPTKASVLDGTGQFDGNWISIEGRFFGRPFEISI